MRGAQFIILLITLTLSWSCSHTASQTATSQRLESNSLATIKQETNYRLEIQAYNLSEDFSVISTNNDELLLLIYEYPKDKEGALNDPLFSEHFVLDKNNKTEVLSWVYEGTKGENGLLILFIEQDSNTPLQQLNPILRIEYNTIIEYYFDRNYEGLEKYLGDEDLLGVGIVKQNSQLNGSNFRFKGIHKLDKYEYTLKFEKNSELDK